MAKNPDPGLKLTSSKGVTRTLDDWQTVFHLVLIVLPDRPEATKFLPIARRILATLGDADCRVAYVVPTALSTARKILGAEAERVLTFVDPDKELVTGLGLERLPALVHLRQNSTVAAATEGWDPVAWQRVAREIGKAMAWSVPEVSRPGDPAPTPGWPVTT